MTQDNFWQDYHRREAEREAACAVRIGALFPDQAYKFARRAAKAAFMVLIHLGEVARDETDEEREAKRQRTQCPECGQEL